MPSKYFTDNTKIRFLNVTFGQEFLVKVVNWIGYNLKPDDVFLPDQLMNFVKENYSPEDVYTQDELKQLLDDEAENW